MGSDPKQLEKNQCARLESVKMCPFPIPTTFAVHGLTWIKNILFNDVTAQLCDFEDSTGTYFTLSARAMLLKDALMKFLCLCATGG